MTPAPTKPIPILIGGHADAALRSARPAATAGCTAAVAARNSTGSSTGSRRFARKKAAPDRSRSTSCPRDAYTPDGIKRLEDKGVTDAIVGFRDPYIMGDDTEPLDAKIRNLERSPKR